jgi:hypothetical protein
MSTVPPQTPPPPPAPSAALPWEERHQRGFLQALFDTMGLFVSRPAEAWARTRETGDITSPLLFGVLVAWFALALQRILMAAVAMPLLPGLMGRRMGMGMMGGLAGAGLVVQIILLPVAIVCGLFIGSAILHFFCLIVGALSGSQSGFEGTFRVMGYSQISSLAAIVPIIGGPVAAVWWVVLTVMGIQRLHRTTQGKAIAAVLVPLAICCGVGVIVFALVGAAIFSRIAH